MPFPRIRSVVDINSSSASEDFAGLFRKHVISNISRSFNSLVFLCIGTDRSTGDSLGPIVGYKLSGLCCRGISILGTLEQPVHAKNLNDTALYIRDQFNNPFVVAVDACLGRQENIGHINIGDGPIYPGAGVNKNLLPVGNINITGVVNTSGYMEYFVLQNTRLSLVMKMADIITNGIMYTIDDIYNSILQQAVSDYSAQPFSAIHNLE
jgi:putative sporulation protein YyaC